MTSVASSSVAFPTTESPLSTPPVTPERNRAQSLLPFRRISLPTIPALLRRQSVISVLSVDSVPEEGQTHGHQSPARPSNKRLPDRHGFDHRRRWSKRRETFAADDAPKEAKRRKIIQEFYETERVYVDGLELIYSIFLTPLVASLDTPSPLLDREQLMTVFSNFVDIWNFHRSFFTSLTGLLCPSISSSTIPVPALSPILTSHFPYLSLYTPFVTSYSHILVALTSLPETNPDFKDFILRQEADERCGKLKLQAWLLTIVQRCPRYLLLIKDLINCTNPEDPERSALETVQSLLSKITASLDTSLHTHSQTLSLLSLQRSAQNLPVQLVSPGRNLVKRGTLLQVDNSSVPKEREFLLFNDCLIWLANDKMIEDQWLRRGDYLLRVTGLGIPGRPDIKRRRSKSENELPGSRANAKRSSTVNSESPEERWHFKGKAELVDLEVIVPAETRRIELLSPEVSFAVYADTESERAEWAEALRSAKSSLLVTLHTMHPNSTLTSSNSAQHLRKSLQALPYMPDSPDSPERPRRGKVDHFVPAIWVPDGKTDCCMRCSRLFGWRRRRHHCRLCGRCVCASCSDRTFVISDPNRRGSHKTARSCNACYEAVFPLLDNAASPGVISSSETTSTLSKFPTLKVTPIPAAKSTPSALMSLGKYHGFSNGEEDPVAYKRVSVHERNRPVKARPVSHLSIPEQFQRAVQDQDKSGLARDGPESPELMLAESPNEWDQAWASPRSLEETNIGNRSNQSSPGMRPPNRKRFSMPALAVQATSVTARPAVTGDGPTKRFSLLLSGNGKARRVVDVGPLSTDVPCQVGHDGFQNGIAAARLAQLLERTNIE